MSSNDRIQVEFEAWVAAYHLGLVSATAEISYDLELGRFVLREPAQDADTAPEPAETP